MRTIVALLLIVTPALAAEPRLEREMGRLAEVAGGVTGATAIHIESGRTASLRGSSRFPMASAFKVPIAIHLLAGVDAGEERLDRMVELRESDLHPGSGILSDLFNKPGVALSLRNLLELMMLISDNSATDVLLRLAGGPEAVTARLQKLGITGIDVSRSTLELISDTVGIEAPSPEAHSPARYAQMEAEVSSKQRKEAARRFNRDLRDTATPDAFARMLVRLHKGELLRPDSTLLLLDIMNRCRTGNSRLKGILPPGTEVAHKTGTISASANDAGIMTLPDNAGHVAIAVFVKSMEKDQASRERAIAEIARAVHDYFLFVLTAGAIREAPDPH